MILLLIRINLLNKIQFSKKFANLYHAISYMNVKLVQNSYDYSLS